MPASSIPSQYDIAPGVSLSAIASPTKVQIEQAIAQAKPYSSVGFIIIANGNNNADGGFFPDVAVNPRFARYIWLDTYTNPPTPKVYDPTAGGGYNSWVTFGLGPDAVLGTHLAAGSVGVYEADGVTPKISAIEDGVAIAAKNRFLLRFDGSGQYVEAVALANILTAGTVPLASLVAGNDNYLLRMDAGIPVWENVNFGSELSDDSVALSKLTGSGITDGWIIVASGGVFIAVSNNDLTSNFLPATSVHLNKLSASSATAGQVPVWNGSNWAPSSGPISGTSTISTDGIVTGTLISDTTQGEVTVAHGLGKIPRMIRVVAVMQTSPSGSGYAIGDEVDLHNFFNASGGGTGRKPFGYAADATDIHLTIHADTQINVIDRDGNGITPIGTDALKLKVYAWA